jgi:type VI protein secretion system component Hcp
MEDPKKQSGAGEIADAQESNAELNTSESEAVVGGAPSGKVTVDDFHFTKIADSSSPSIIK